MVEPVPVDRYDVHAAAPYTAVLPQLTNGQVALALPVIGDLVLARRLERGEEWRLEVAPPGALPELTDADNAVLRAARMLADGTGARLSLRLEKGLGIGTGLGSAATAAMAATVATNAVLRLGADAPILRATARAAALGCSARSLDIHVEAAARGSITIVSDDRPVRAVKLRAPVAVAVILPELDEARGPKRGAGALEGLDGRCEDAARALAEGDTDVLGRWHAAQREQWLAAGLDYLVDCADEAVRAGAWALIAVRGGPALLSFSSPQQIPLVRSRLVDRLGEHGVWTRARAGILPGPPARCLDERDLAAGPHCAGGS